jgi:hypothetical protein
MQKRKKMLIEKSWVKDFYWLISGICVGIEFGKSDFLSEVEQKIVWGFQEVTRFSDRFARAEDSVVSCEFFEGEEVHR